MTDATSEPSIPVLFRGEYEREMESWFRRRFLSLCLVFGAIEALSLSIYLVLWWASRSSGADAAGEAIRRSVDGLTLPAAVTSSMAHFLILGVFALVRTRQVETRQGLVHEATWMIVLLGGVHLALESVATLLGATDIFRPAASIFFWHFCACLILPWTPRESLRPMLPLIGAYIVASLLLRTDGGVIRVEGGTGAEETLQQWKYLQPLLSGLLMPLVLVPGMVACWWRLTRHRRRFGRRMASQGFMELRRELSQARKIHESLFPRPVNHEDVHFDLLYRPMRELGGDFVQAWTDPLDRFNVVVIDVTGHGLAAAMTVNRLAGELDRIRAENPLISPAAVLAGLNRYIHLTLARHVIFGTAVAAQLDPHSGRLVVANAGHPAAILRRRVGTVESRESTAFLLGAMAHTDFEVTEEVTHLQPGDVLMLVTDGVIEARDRRGRVFGEGRLREACSRQPPPERWSEFLATQIDQWSGGVLHDDLLIATLALSPTARVIVPRASDRGPAHSTRTDDPAVTAAPATLSAPIVHHALAPALAGAAPIALEA